MSMWPSPASTPTARAGVLPALLSDTFGHHISAATHGIAISVWACCTIIGVNVFSSITSRFYVVVGTAKVATPFAYQFNCYWLCGWVVACRSA